MKIKTEQIIEDLKRVENIIGKPPTKNEYKEMGKYGINTICRRFGSWNKALSEVFGEVRKSSPEGTITKKCNNPDCNKTITINKSSEKEHNFCSKSCTAKVLNKIHKKRKLSNQCEKCKTLIIKNRTYCDNCFIKMREDFKNRTIQELIESNTYRTIRSNARVITSNRDQKCSKCGYNKHVQTCHIKPISSFPLDTKLATVNAEDNLLLLCPNCHWELDHDL